MSQSRRYPVIASDSELTIPWRTFSTVLRGVSIIDINEVTVSSNEAATEFIRAYGLNLEETGDKKELKRILDIAKKYMATELLPYEGLESIPEEVASLDVPGLLKLAGNSAAEEGTELGRWACAILKVCHAAAHARWTHDAEAQAAARRIVEARYLKYLSRKDDLLWFGDHECMIPLHNFKVRESKTLNRIITKLLHKQDNLSQNIYDRLGVRLVTVDAFSAILLLKFLRTRGVFMYANALPQEAKNSIIELDQIKSMFKFPDPVDLEREIPGWAEDFNEQVNRFSSADYRMIKVVERLLVHTPSGRRVFYPYEIQILTMETMDALDSSDARHSEYRNRQRQAVCKRLFWI